MPIQLSISEVCEEIRHLKDAARDLLDPSTAGVLSVFEQTLSNIVWTEPGYITDWEITQESPIVTEISEGEFCFNGKTGGHHCLAEITCLWRITPVKPGKKQKNITCFQVADIASVHVKVFDVVDLEKADLLGSWRMELGDHNAPGCFFHTQILAEKDRKVCPFPHTFDVPRLPSYLFTPMSVVEFVLAELFQDKWRSLDRQVSPEIKGWAKIQRDRFLKTFLWHIRQTESAPGSPWMHLKSQIPAENWFLRTDLSLNNPSSFLTD